MTTISFSCPHCSQPFQTDASRAGAKGSCPKCKGTVVVPDAQPIEPILAVAPTHEPAAPKTLGSCPYCRGEMLSTENIRACPTCETPHHEECWTENKGCTVFGCSMAPPEEEKVAVQLPDGLTGQIAGPYLSTADDLLEYEKAGLGRRFGTYVLDYILYLVSVFIVWVIIGVFAQATGSDFEALLQMEFFINLLVFAGYYILFESTLGRTPAKYLTGTMVMTEDYGKPSFEKIVGRTLSRMVPFEPFSFFGQDKSGWHDRWSGTIVVMAKPIVKTAENHSSTGETAAVTSGAFVVMLEDGSQSGWISEQMVLDWLRMGKVSQSSMIYSADSRAWNNLREVFNLDQNGVYA